LDLSPFTLSFYWTYPHLLSHIIDQKVFNDFVITAYKNGDDDIRSDEFLSIFKKPNQDYLREVAQRYYDFYTKAVVLLSQVNN